MKTDDCFSEGLLKKITAGKQEVDNSLAQARHYLGRAQGVLDAGYADVAFLMAYNSMFHSARALLFNEGVKERSHYCMILYLKEKYRGQQAGEYLKVLDSYRLDRHSVQYGGGTCSKEAAEQATKDAKELLAIAEKLLAASKTS